MIRADLHMHSTVSDGSFTIPELIARARQNGLDAIAITDHDTLSQRFQIPADTGLQVLTGIEISAYDYENDFRVHMLGYGIQKPEVTEQAVHPTLEARHANSLKQIEILNQHGYEIDLSQLRRADGKYIYKQHIMDDLVRRGKAPDMFGEFYQKTFKHGGICDFDIRYPSPLEALRAIKDAGGLAVLAHSGQQQNFCIIPELAKQGLDGLELQRKRPGNHPGICCAVRPVSHRRQRLSRQVRGRFGRHRGLSGRAKRRSCRCGRSPAMIRRAVQADLPEIYQLICALEETAFPKEIFTWGYDAILADSSHLLLVAEEQGKVQGVLHLRMEFQLHHCDRIAEIMELIVSPAARSKGVGKALITAVKEQALLHHCVQIEVTSNQKRTNAHRFYQREGLTLTHVKLTLPITE